LQTTDPHPGESATIVSRLSSLVFRLVYGGDGDGDGGGGSGSGGSGGGGLVRSP